MLLVVVNAVPDEVLFEEVVKQIKTTSPDLILNLKG